MLARRGTRGFSALELVAVLFILALLGAAAVLGTDTIRDGGKELSAEMSVRRVVAAQSSYAEAFGEFTTDQGKLTISGDVLLVSAESTKASEVSVAVHSSGTLGVAAQGGEGSCVVWLVAHPAAGGHIVDQVEVGDSCSGAAAVATLD